MWILPALVVIALASAPAAKAADLRVTQTSVPQAPQVPMAGYDVVFRPRVTNAGPETATGVSVSSTVTPTVPLVWMSPGCSLQAGAVRCSWASLAPGAAAEAWVVYRPAIPGTVSNTATASSDQPDPNPADNTHTLDVSVGPAATATFVTRYRLYSTVTLEHHFTTSLTEYQRLSTFTGVWYAEGPSGQVMNAPGSHGGVQAVPYYRLYDSTNHWHHWTTDPNEYYTLVQRPNWTGEGVDGFLLPSQVAGTIPLRRLAYRGIPGLHHWTVDAYEVSVLTTPERNWVEEPGAGYLLP